MNEKTIEDYKAEIAKLRSVIADYQSVIKNQDAAIVHYRTSVKYYKEANETLTTDLRREMDLWEQRITGIEKRVNEGDDWKDD